MKFHRTFAVGLLLSTGLFAAGSNDQTFTGTVSDTMCGAHHTMMPGKPDAECVRACVKAGIDYALVVGNKVYTLKGNKSDLDKFAGQQATVTGKLSGTTIEASSVAAAKKSK
ncbi:MAG: hypothetical protein LAO06_12365 [Acidobacteriia bacterium]|nr:hypothetical protein [Terriglobia bacterium]